MYHAKESGGGCFAVYRSEMSAAAQKRFAVEEQMRSALTDSVASVMKDFTSLVVLLTVAFIMDWRLALIAFIAFPLTVLPILRMSRRLR